MRDAVETWGRQRWPKARVVHELVVGDCRIDMAFVSPDDLVGVEIKSSKDVLDRLDKQLRVFREHLPEVWLAVAEKWRDVREDHWQGTFVVGETGVEMSVPTPSGVRLPVTPPNRNWTCYPAMLALLWADELRAVASRARISHSPRAAAYKLRPDMARLMTGDEILKGVCRELRGRNAFWKADPPIIEEVRGPATQPPPAARLFR